MIPLREDTAPRRRRSTPLILRLTLAFAAGLAALLVAGSIWQSWESRRDLTRYPPPGRMVDAGGHKLFLDCAGSGAPTVVFDAGLGDSHLAWIKVHAEAAKFTRACVYDRAGMGWSEPGPVPRDSERLAGELHALLTNAGERAPFLLVSHSMAGLHARVYARRYGAELAGLVLVDPTPASVFASPPPDVAPLLEGVHALSASVVPLGQVLAYTGVIRALGAINGQGALAGPLRTADASTQHLVMNGPSPAQFRALASEEQALPDDWREALASPGLGDLPVALLEARKPLPGTPFLTVFLPRGYDLGAGLRAMQEAAFADHARMVKLSARGRLIRAEDSGHYVQDDQPELVIQTIREMAAATSSTRR